MPDWTVSVSSPSPPYACAKRQRQRWAAREDEAMAAAIPVDAGDADVELGVFALHKGEHVVAFIALHA